jgi:trehalose synthase-fused probable maltokinase
MIDEQSLIEFVTAKRWFGAKTRNVVHAHLLDRIPLGVADPALVLELVELGFDTGTHDVYQLLGDGSLDVLDDPAEAGVLLRLMREGASAPGAEGTVQFFATGDRSRLGRAPSTVRVIDAEQSNSSVVFDEELILKVFRRVSPGLNPELEVLRFLTEHGFENIARIVGWYAYAGGPLDATLGILQDFLADGVDGWELALGTMTDGAGGILPHVRRLGEVTGRMHSVLGSESSDPSFASEESPAEALALLTATVDEAIERLFRDLPSGNAEIEPIRGRGEEVRERLRVLTRVGSVGRVIRQHGDFHLGQTLWTGDDWILVDFEGEPARPLSERRLKRSPLRDVAGMLRSFAYAASVSVLANGVESPAGWEAQARSEFLAGYLGAVDGVLVPSGTALDRLLAVFELEKAVYELRYELDNRPGWIGIPVAAIARMLDEEVPG